MDLPSVLKKHLGRIPPTPMDKLNLPLEEWVRYFFMFALDKKKKFYWAWQHFMITIRREKGKTVLVLEIFLPKAPFLLQKHVDITHIPNPVLVNSLMFLYNHYKGSQNLRRNREHSVRYLSFLSFAQMLANHDIKKLPTLETDAGINRLLVAYLIKTLDLYDVPLHLQGPKPDRRYSISELVSRTGSLKP